jgi:outer membrane protein assembly factor BamD
MRPLLAFRPLLTLVVTSVLFGACSAGMPYPGLTALEIYNIGVQAMEAERWDAAVDAFEAMVLTSGFEFAAEARLRLAQSEFERENFIESRAEFQRTIDRFPTDTTAPHAALGVCRSLAELSPNPHRDQSFTRQAGTSCRQVAAEYAGTLVGLRAAELSAQMLDRLAERDYNTGLHYLKRGLLDSALLYFEAVEQIYPGTTWAPFALMKKIEVFEKFGYRRDIEETREKLLELYPDSEPAALIDDTVG